MTRLMRATIALLCVTILLAFSPGPAARAHPALQNPTCTVTVDKTAAPPEIKLGETVTVSLTVNGSCPEKEQSADVILAIDHTESMNGAKFAAAQTAATTFVNMMDPSLVHIGIVAVASQGVVVQALTSDQAKLVATIQGLAIERGTNIVGGLDASRAELMGPDARTGVRKVIVFLTDGRQTVTNPPISALDGVIAAVRAAGIEVFAIGLGSDADVGVLQRMASDAAHYYYSPTASDLQAIYVQIAGRTKAAVLFTSATITDIVPANMIFIPGSGTPIEPTYDSATRTLTWTHTNVTAPGYTLTYQLRPTEVGTWPTNVSAQLDYVDGFANPGSTPFPVPTVRVIAHIPTGASCVCKIVLQRVPRVVIEDALANPGKFYGWQYPLDPGKPPSPANPPRECLTLANVSTDYHPIWNKPQWRVGCP
jgi:Mg-chelatase subunit ChlD